MNLTMQWLLSNLFFKNSKDINLYEKNMYNGFFALNATVPSFNLFWK